MPALDQHVRRGDHPAVGGTEHRRVVTDPDDQFGAAGKARPMAAIKANSPNSAMVMCASSHRCRADHPDAPATAAYGSVATTPTTGGDMVQAYILVQTEVGKAADVATSIGQITGVTQADDVTGPYDVIVRAEADNVDDLGRLVVAQIQGVPGITRTLTCPIVHI